MTATLLIELGTEELPPKALRRLADAFAAGIAAGLDAEGIARGAARALASPRRLAVAISGVAERADDRAEERLGPALIAAFDAHGEPTKAAQGFARSCGVAVGALERGTGAKGGRLAYRGRVVGQTLAELLPTILDATLKGLPIPKRMRWGGGDQAFVRPVHWLAALHGNVVLPLIVFGHRAGRNTYGHRFHHPAAIALAHADDYAVRLEEPGRVLVDMDRRRAAVHAGVVAAARESGGQIRPDNELLEEVSALVEWPVALAGGFDDRFLELPQEVLTATLEGHQRYFTVFGANDEMLARFVTVANIESRQPQQVIAGNERVVHPRLADALFFWDQDRHRGLAALVPGLARVSFQRELGSLAEKSRRVAGLAAWLAQELGADGDTVARAAALSKADLLTDMVAEFPELQGTMGRYYALAAGEPEAVATAIEEQYRPRRANDPIATSLAGRILGLADRLDSLAGAFALGQRPSGDKDPYGLRRAAVGVLRTLIEGGLELDLRTALKLAAQSQPSANECDATADGLLAFHLDRLGGYYRDRGVDAAVFAAVAANGLGRPWDFDRRIDAVRGFVELAAAAKLCGAHKRIRNIVKRGGDGGGVIAADLLVEPAEKELNSALAATSTDVEGRRGRADYAGALARLAELQQPVDRFFDQVLVMSEDAALKRNRLALLAHLDALCRSVADISLLTPEPT